MDDISRVHEAYSAEQVVHDVLDVVFLKFQLLTIPESRSDISYFQVHHKENIFAVFRDYNLQ